MLVNHDFYREPTDDTFFVNMYEFPDIRRDPVMVFMPVDDDYEISINDVFDDNS